MEPAKPAFGKNLVPVYAFYMPTEHKAGEGDQEIRDKLADRLLSQLPEADRAKAKVFLDQKLGEFRAEDIDRKEAHIVVIAHNESSGMYEGFACEGSDKKNEGFKANYSITLGKCDDYAFAKAQTALTTAGMMFKPEWKGIRGTPIEIEAKTFAEFMQKINTAGIMDHFIAMYPETEKMETPVISTVPELTPARRKQLVKRFGAKNIADLEKKIKSSKK